MKKKQTLVLTLALFFLAAGASLWLTRARSFDEIWGGQSWVNLPAQPGGAIYTRNGPTWEDPNPDPSAGQSYRAVMNLLRGRTYHRSLPSPMGDGGTAIYLTQGCTSCVVAYWSGGRLWVLDEGEKWIAYTPGDLQAFEEKLQTLLLRYGAVKE